ncbi:Di-copper centre-containing protein [Plenodomus tracheiphilus IPT5]|uniref:tyrosinase n=1 Tax=Plenodomus tracheiphilus IPT5 TaxID=1408161 RepID=A0A6A7AZP2_9PLEO|nr:Di-copper centre-containing protein [Plenodomus tracheiphilus IPT5]
MPMAWLSRCLLLVLVLSVVTCTELVQSRPLRARQAYGIVRGVVRGVNTTDEEGHVYVRREIRDLKTNYPDQWNLYLLALESLQWTDQEDPYSYYGLAQIHGRPYKVWEDAPGLTHKLGTASYCPHSNQLFLGWHRPYIALFEEILHEHMRNIASTAPLNRVERYEAAAHSFRMPYWDWGLGGTAADVPDFFVNETIPLVELDGSETVMANPLHSYKFNPLVPEDFDDKWKQINKTVRWPESNNATAISRQDIFVNTFKSQSTSLIGAVETAFRSSNFSQWAKQLEDPHGWMHGVIGGGWDETQSTTKFRGHMWPLEYSAFEPLFMLHHTNVDRLWALFQAIKPNATMGRSNIGPNGNVYLEDDQYVNASTELLPFRRASGAFWTTTDCHDTKVLGYAYPETQSWNFASNSMYMANVTSTIARLYASKPRSLLVDSGQVANSGMHASLDQDNTFTDWTIQSEAMASRLPSTFVVRFSLVKPGSSEHGIDVGTWMRLMPSTHDRMREREGAVPKTRAYAVDVVRGTTGLTTHLLDRIAAGELASLKAGDVVPYLTERLAWKVFSGDGEQISGEALKAMKIEVASSRARIPDDPGALVEYGEDLTRYPEITTGKPGGARG